MSVYKFYCKISFCSFDTVRWGSRNVPYTARFFVEVKVWVCPYIFGWLIDINRNKIWQKLKIINFLFLCQINNSHFYKKIKIVNVTRSTKTKFHFQCYLFNNFALHPPTRSSVFWYRISLLVRFFIFLNKEGTCFLSHLMESFNKNKGGTLVSKP